MRRIIRRVQVEVSREDNRNYVLPGFEELGVHIKVNNRQRHLSVLKCPEVCECLEAAERRHEENPRIVKLRQLAALMRKYARTEPEITVKEVCEREAK